MGRKNIKYIYSKLNVLTVEIQSILFPACICVCQDPSRHIDHCRNVHLWSRIKSYDGNQTRSSSAEIALQRMVRRLLQLGSQRMTLFPAPDYQAVTMNTHSQVRLNSLVGLMFMVLDSWWKPAIKPTQTRNRNTPRNHEAEPTCSMLKSHPPSSHFPVCV